jgi:hypothetical protein
LRFFNLGLLRRQESTYAGTFQLALARSGRLLLLLVLTVIVLAAGNRSRSGRSGFVALHAFVRVVPAATQQSMGEQHYGHQIGQDCVHGLPKPLTAIIVLIGRTVKRVAGKCEESTQPPPPVAWETMPSTADFQLNFGPQLAVVGYVMNSASRSIRLSVLCLLTISWAAAVFNQPIPMGHVARANSIGARPVRRCCCACQDCKCCVCCCNESLPNEEHATPPVRSGGNEEFKPLVLFQWVTAPAESAAGGVEAIHQGADGQRVLRAPSLQANHVRIQA